ncbi:glycosyltransferase involved in cell wall biosynthesis [Neorhizobium galegae]|nr:glycosyltransferase involved in cell wall biosynthesis [Neorhizobium galegae]
MRHLAEMKIAFYAPLKSPNHPVPSGDRLMARQILSALTLAGHDVKRVSEFRSFSATPDVPDDQKMIAEAERERIAVAWRSKGLPDLWFCYHPYYKAPDLLGLELCRQFSLPYVTAESSYSRRRNIGGWALSQEMVLSGIRQARVNICLTQRDHQGLLDVAPAARFARLSPFVDPAPFLAEKPRPEPRHLMTVAMMRPGDKLSSYTALAEALHRLCDLDWTLTIIGDGPARAEVEQAFGAALPPGRVRFVGQKEPGEVAEYLSRGAIYLWPGHGEAYGLAYLEAQAAGLPVIAENVAGVPEVVDNGRTGLLTPPGDAEAYADAIRALLTDEPERQRLATNARRFVAEERSLSAASLRLHQILETSMKESP